MHATTILCTSLTAALLATAAAARPFDQTVSATADGTVRVSNVAGSIKIVGGNRSDIHVFGTIDDKVEDVSIEAKGDEVEIEVELSDHIRGNGGEAELVIEVPSGNRVEVETVSASVDVDGVKGELELESVSGGVVVHGDAAGIEVDTVSGAIDVDGRIGRVETESVSGATTLRGIHGTIESKTTSGAIDLDAAEAAHVECTSVSGVIRFRGTPKKDAELTFENFSGAVELALPADLDADVEVHTFSGGIDSDFGGQVERPEHGPGASLAKTFGEGAARISVNTFSGAVALEKRGAGESGEKSKASKSSRGK